MPPSVTPLSARGQTLTIALFALIVAMGVSPLFDLVTVRWPLRFGEVPWRFQTLQLFFANGPQFAVLIGVLALFAVLIGHRMVVRSASVALGVLAVVTLAMLPFFVLDYFQMARLVAQDHKAAFKVAAMKTIFFACVLAAGAVWSLYAGWLASEPPDVAARREKGEGLVVGQPKPPRAPT